MARFIPFRRRRKPQRPRKQRGAPNLLVGLIFIGALGLIATFWPESGDRLEPIRGEVRGFVSKVRDGDTIEVAGVPVRLNGLHCPERDQEGGWQATAAMQEMVDGAEVTCHLNGETTYDRQVGWCEARGRDLAATLIRRRLCARCARHDVEGRYTDVQRQAGAWTKGWPSYCG